MSDDVTVVARAEVEEADDDDEEEKNEDSQIPCSLS